MRSLTMKKRKIILTSVMSTFLVALLTLTGVGFYFKLTHKEKFEPKVGPLDFSISAWDGQSSNGLDFNADYAGRGEQTKTINSAASFVYFINQIKEGNTFEGVTIYLNSNIDLCGYAVDPIGTEALPFKGTFDGGYYTIFNAKLNGKGLFGYTDNATIKNVGLYNCDSYLIDNAINTNIENTFVRLGNKNLVNNFVSNNGTHFIKNSFVDSSANGLINNLNTNNSSENEVALSNCYYTIGEAAVNNYVGETFIKQENVIKPTSVVDFVNWSYSSNYTTGKQWCDYDYLEGSNKLDFNYPLQSGFVKVYLTGSCYESVLVSGESVVNISNLPQAFEEADKIQEAEINLLVEKIFLETQAELKKASVVINAEKDTTIVRGENNTKSMFVSSGTSKIVLGEETNEETATLTLDGNKDYIEENNLTSGALVVATGGSVEINNNVVLKNNINNNINYGGAVFVYNTSEPAKIDATIINCHAENGGGVAAVGTMPTSLGSISDCSAQQNGGAAYLVDSFVQASDLSALRDLYGHETSVKPMAGLELTTGSTNIAGQTYENNLANKGAAIYVSGEATLRFGTTEEERTYFRYNHSKGGAVCFENVNSIETIQFVTFDSNRQYNNQGAPGGGAILILGSSGEGAHTATFDNGCKFINNYAYFDGGAIYSDGYDLNFMGADVQFEENRADDGSAIYVNGSLEIEGDLLFSKNKASENIIQATQGVDFTSTSTSNFDENEAGNAIVCSESTIYVNNCDFGINNAYAFVYAKLNNNETLSLQHGNIMTSAKEKSVVVENLDGTANIEIFEADLSLHIINGDADPVGIEIKESHPALNISVDNYNKYANSANGHYILKYQTDSVSVDWDNISPIDSYVEGVEDEEYTYVYFTIYEIEYKITEENSTTKQYKQGEIVNLLQPKLEGHNFDGWYRDDLYADQFTVGSTMPSENITLYAKWTKKQYKITFVVDENSKDFGAIAVNGNASTEVIVEYGDIVSFDENELSLGEDEILAVPSEANDQFVYSFVKWEIPIEINEVTEAFVVKAYFARELNSHIVAINVNDASRGTVDKSSVTVKYGTLISFKDNQLKFAFNEGQEDEDIQLVNANIKPKTDKFTYSFNEWTGIPEGNEVKSGGITVTANFNETINQYKVNFDANGGTVAETDRLVDYGAPYGELPEPTFTGYNFMGWFTQKTGGTPIVSTTPMERAEEHTIYAQWEAAKFKVILHLYDDETEEIEVEFNSTITLPKAPTEEREGYAFVGWFKDLNRTQEFDISVMPAHDLDAYAGWLIKTYIIKATSGTNGSISPSGNVPVEHGRGEIFTFTAEEGYHVASILIDGTALNSAEMEDAIENGYTFNNVTANGHTIEVTFAINVYTITATSGENGRISPSGNVPVNHGDDPAFEFTPSTGYHVASILVDGVALEGDELEDAIVNGYTFIDVTANGHKIEVTFAINVYTISAISSANGCIKYRLTEEDEYLMVTDGKVSVNYNNNVQFNFEPEEGYHVASILIDGTALAGDELAGAIENGYTFENVTKEHSIEVVFEITTFTLTYVLNNGLENVVQDYHYGDPIELIANPTQEGYTFDDWYNEDSFENKFKTETMPANNLTIYANWNINSYTIHYVYNGAQILEGGMPLVASEIYKYQEVLNLPIPELTDYTFAGWYEDEGFANRFGYEKMPHIESESITLYAKYSQNVFTITFDYNCDELEDFVDKYEMGSTVELKDPRTREGYILEGWYTEESCVNKFDFIMPEGDVTVYANWVAITYTVEYNGNGHTSGSTASSTHTYDEEKELTVNGFEKTGYTFVSWNTQQDGKGVTYADKAKVKNLTSKNEATVTLYAQWKANEYTVEYNGNGHTSGSTVSSSHTYDVEKALTSNGYTKEGWTFISWNTQANGEGDSYTNGAKVKNLTDENGVTIILYAQWSIDSYTVTYKPENGENDIVHPYDYDATITLPNDPTKTGYIFGGWFDVKHGQITNSTKMPADNVVAVAKWTAISYTIKYDGNGHTSGSTASSTHTYDVDLKLTKNGYAKLGYTFVGWNTEVNGSGIKYDDEATVKNLTDMNNGIVILYAQWDINSYDVVYLLELGANAYATQTYQYDQSITLPGDPDKVGYTFKGWFDVNSHTEWINGTHMPAGNVTVVAKWEINSYTLSYHLNYEGAGVHTETYAYGATIVWLNNVTRTGYNFAAWYTTDACITQVAITKMPAENVDVYAKWDIKQFGISISYTGNGSVDPSVNQTVDYGSDLTINIDPDNGYHVKQIIVDDVALNTVQLAQVIENGYYKFSGIDKDHSIHVEFDINKYKITASSTGAGTITPNGESEYKFGETVSYVASPDIGYSIKAIYVDGTPLDVDFTGLMSYSYEFKNISENHTISVEFSSSEFMIGVTYEGEGVVSPDETFSAMYGDDKTITFAPNEGSYVSAIQIDGLDLVGNTLNSVINQGSYTFLDIHSNRSIHIVFTAHVYKVTIKTDGTGTVTSDKDLNEVKHGEDRTINLNIDLDKYSVDLYINGIKINGFSENTISLKNIDKDIVIEIKITKKSFFETKLGILIIVCFCLFIVLVVVSIPTIRKIIRNKRLRIIK